jgi:hypothetical protein
VLCAENVEFYTRNGIPFVVGTTGGDREKLMQVARDSNCYAVIAPQMGKQACFGPFSHHNNVKWMQFGLRTSSYSWG